jgi:hypothetical protein
MRGVDFSFGEDYACKKQVPAALQDLQANLWLADNQQRTGSSNY